MPELQVIHENKEFRDRNCEDACKNDKVGDMFLKISGSMGIVYGNDGFVHKNAFMIKAGLQLPA